MNKIVTIISLVLTVSSASAQHEWTLQECTNYAVENNIQVKKSEQTLQSQEIRLNSSQNAYLPDVSASAS